MRSTTFAATIPAGSRRAAALADRLEQGARALADFARGLDAGQWRLRTPKDGRKVGVIVHHVASMYPIEMGLVDKLAAGEPVVGVSWDDVDAINAEHAAKNDGAGKEEAIGLLLGNSAEAAAAIRKLTDEQLDLASPISLDGDAPLTCQYFVEFHPVRHAWHHLAKLRAAVGR
ncbi:MAG: DinB family protein [Acidobacteria bacterium]|nr:DinB family protein [Acidobacteriota bacterium]MCB9379040.1 DinB family protein [Holophagales bacterium]